MQNASPVDIAVLVVELAPAVLFRFLRRDFGGAKQIP
jgi:hypothetical protein